MEYTVPDYIKNAKVIGEPISYEWNSDLGLKFYAAQDQNVKLYQAIDKSNFKAKLAIGIAITEWIFYRFEGQAQVADGWKRIEAAWACNVNPLYANDLRFKLTPAVHEKGMTIEGPIELALSSLGKMYARFTKGSIDLAEPVVRQAVLARHILGNRKGFDNWLTETVRRSVEVFPRQGDYDKMPQKYGALDEVPVPREFFKPGFVYTPEAGKKSLQEFLETLDYTKNPYLRSPEELEAKGFQGIPYVL